MTANPMDSRNPMDSTAPAKNPMDTRRAAGAGITISRSRHAQQFVTIGNAEVRDTSVSFRARGIHHYLLSLPDGWRVTTAQMAEDNPEGLTAIRAALAELERAGYVTATNTRGERGRLRLGITVHDMPQAERTHLLGKGARKKPVENGSPQEFPQVAPVMQKPVSGGPVTGGPVSGEPVTYQKTVTEDGSTKTKEKRRALSLTDLLQEELPDATDEERELILSEIQNKEAMGEIRNARAWLRTVITNGDAQSLLETMREELTHWETRPPAQPRCGRPDIPGSTLSEACRRSRWPDECVHDWCQCLCHGSAGSTDDDFWTR